MQKVAGNHREIEMVGDGLASFFKRFTDDATLVSRSSPLRLVDASLLDVSGRPYRVEGLY